MAKLLATVPLIVITGNLILVFHFASAKRGLVNMRKRQSATTVRDLVAGLYYSNTGTVLRTDNYRLIDLQSIYNEGYSYLDEPADSRWRENGNMRYLYQVTLNSSGQPTEFENNTDFPSPDYKFIPLSSNVSRWQDCRKLCALAALHCSAWTFDNKFPKTAGCHMKGSVSKKSPKAGIISGCMNYSESKICTTSIKNASAPPSGMRSAVPLGSLGGGTIELRADGRLADWEIFNNGPQARGGGKVNINEAVLGILSQPLPSDGQRQSTAAPFASLLRTHMDSTNKELPVIESLTYSGAFPAARLVAEDSTLKQGITVTAFSPFMRQNPNKSVTPAIAFHVNISNPRSHDIDMAVFFNLPDMLSGMSSSIQTSFASYSSESITGVTLTSTGATSADARLNGDLTIAVMHKTDEVQVDCISVKTSNSLKEAWQAFVSGDGVFANDIQKNSTQASVAAKLRVAASSSSELTVVLSWFFPHRLFADREIGQYYANFFSSSQNAADSLASELIPVLRAVKDWNEESQFTHGQQRFKEAFPSNFLDDALVNSPGAITKTSMFLNDGRWRQWESYSCSQMEPPSIHGYRALVLNSLFPDLEHQTLMLYADQMTSDGLVSEKFGGLCDNASANYNLDVGDGDGRGDDNAIFIMDVYVNLLNYDEKEGQDFLDKIWPKLKLAVEWQMAHATKYGLTEDLVNAFDEHGQIGDVNSYDAFLYISSLSAAVMLSNMTSSPNSTFVAEVADARDRGVKSLHELLWAGTFYRSFWCANGHMPANALQGDTLYGALWDKMYNFNTPLPIKNLVSHLHEERRRNLTPYGIRFCSGRTTPSYHCGDVAQSKTNYDAQQTPFSVSNAAKDVHVASVTPEFSDNDTWEAHTLNSGTLSLFLRSTSDEKALGLSALIIDKYRLTLRDQWDYRDLSSCYKGDVPGTTDCSIRPVCNSHYSRQLIFWALLIALGGQRFEPASGTLHLSPRQIVCEQWPILLGGRGSALMRPAGHTITYEPVPQQRGWNIDEQDGPVLEGVALAGECYEIEVYSGIIEVRHLKLFGVTLTLDVSVPQNNIATYCF